MGTLFQFLEFILLSEDRFGGEQQVWKLGNLMTNPRK